LWTVYAGDVDLEGNGVTHKVAQIFIHYLYENDWMHFNENDIALIKVGFLKIFL
jgi:hypothetical protein